MSGQDFERRMGPWEGQYRTKGKPGCVQELAVLVGGKSEVEEMGEGLRVHAGGLSHSLTECLCAYLKFCHT